MTYFTENMSKPINKRVFIIQVLLLNGLKMKITERIIIKFGSNWDNEILYSLNRVRKLTTWKERYVQHKNKTKKHRF